MQGLRSRAGIVAMTAGAVALLSVPVIAFGKGPPEVKGGGQDTPATVAAPEAGAPGQPPGQVKQAAEPKPAPAPKATPPGQAKPKAVPRGQAKRQGAAPAPVPGRGPDGTGPPGQAKKSGPPPRGRARGHSKAQPSSEPAGGNSEPGGSPAEPGGGSPDEPTRSPAADEPDVTGGIDLPRADDVDTADTGDGGGAEMAGAVVSDTVELPEDASPETLPFTGLGLAFIAMGGLMALAGGALLRRSVAR